LDEEARRAGPRRSGGVFTFWAQLSDFSTEGEDGWALRKGGGASLIRRCQTNLDFQVLGPKRAAFPVADHLPAGTGARATEKNVGWG